MKSGLSLQHLKKPPKPQKSPQTHQLGNLLQLQLGEKQLTAISSLFKPPLARTAKLGRGGAEAGAGRQSLPPRPAPPASAPAPRHLTVRRFRHRRRRSGRWRRRGAMAVLVREPLASRARPWPLPPGGGSVRGLLRDRARALVSERW